MPASSLCDSGQIILPIQCSVSLWGKKRHGPDGRKSSETDTGAVRASPEDLEAPNHGVAAQDLHHYVGTFRARMFLFCVLCCMPGT